MAAPPFALQKLNYKQPVLTIVRQPQKRGYRFRYASEGLTHGGIRGDPREGEKDERIYPSIKLSGYRGRAKVVLTIVTANNNDKDLHLHAHSLVVNREETKGFHVFDLDGSDPVLELTTVAIQHVDKKNQKSKLMDRLLQSQFLQKFGWSSSIMHEDAKRFADLVAFTRALEDKDENSGFVDRATNKEIIGKEKAKLEKKSESLSKSMDMSKCRFCFQVFCVDNDGHFSRKLDPVYSDIIYDGKTAQGAQLKIQRISKVSSNVSGNEEVWLIGDKLNPDDIQVRFFEETPTPHYPTGWEAFGSFSKTDVHKQIVLIFKTPEYRDKNIEQPANVSLELRRKSDASCKSEPLNFKYTPNIDRYGLGEKRKKNIPMEEILAFSHLKKPPCDTGFPSLRPVNNNNNNNQVSFNFPAVNNTFMQNFNMNNMSTMFNEQASNSNPFNPNTAATSSSFNPINPFNPMPLSTSTVFSTMLPSRNNPTVANGIFSLPNAAGVSSATFGSLLTSTQPATIATSRPLGNTSIPTSSNTLNRGVIKTEEDITMQNTALYSVSSHTQSTSNTNNNNNNIISNDLATFANGNALGNAQLTDSMLVSMMETS